MGQSQGSRHRHVRAVPPSPRLCGGNERLIDAGPAPADNTSKNTSPLVIYVRLLYLRSVQFDLTSSLCTAPLTKEEIQAIDEAGANGPPARVSILNKCGFACRRWVWIVELLCLLLALGVMFVTFAPF